MIPELLPHDRREASEAALLRGHPEPARWLQEPVHLARHLVRGQARAHLHREEWRRLQASFGKQGTYRKLKHEGLFDQGPLSLTCAAPGCGCKITFAPKTKGTGEHTREYRYYRCADGKRVHIDGGERQVNVREEDILDALGEAVERINIDDFIAEAIAHGAQRHAP